MYILKVVSIEPAFFSTFGAGDCTTASLLANMLTHKCDVSELY